MAKLSARGRREVCRFERPGGNEQLSYTDCVAVMTDGAVLMKTKVVPKDGRRPHDTGWKLTRLRFEGKLRPGQPSGIEPEAVEYLTARGYRRIA